MVTRAGEGTVLLAKKLGGLVLIILGCLLMAAGVNLASTGMLLSGVLALVAGVIFWVLKIIRRNENGPV
jgi:Flp pilus assembly protein TadB